MASAAGLDAARHMDGIYAGQRHIYDLTRKYYLLGRDRLIERLAVPPGGNVLELGCGTARNLIAVARRYPDSHCFGVDVSHAMLATAATSVARAGLTARIALAQGDATAFAAPDLGHAGFDRVMLSYTLSMIPDWRAVIERSAEALNPGGALHIIDFGQQARLPGPFRVGLHAWLARFDVTPRVDLLDAVALLVERFLQAFAVAGDGDGGHIDRARIIARRLLGEHRLRERDGDAGSQQGNRCLPECACAIHGTSPSGWIIADCARTAAFVLGHPSDDTDGQSGA